MSEFVQHFTNVRNPNDLYVLISDVVYNIDSYTNDIEDYQKVNKAIESLFILNKTTYKVSKGNEGKGEKFDNLTEEMRAYNNRVYALKDKALPAFIKYFMKYNIPFQLSDNTVSFKNYNQNVKHDVFAFHFAEDSMMDSLEYLGNERGDEFFIQTLNTKIKDLMDKVDSFSTDMNISNPMEIKQTIQGIRNIYKTILKILNYIEKKGNTEKYQKYVELLNAYCNFIQKKQENLITKIVTKYFDNEGCIMGVGENRNTGESFLIVRENKTLNTIFSLNLNSEEAEILNKVINNIGKKKAKQNRQLDSFEGKTIFKKANESLLDRVIIETIEKVLRNTKKYINENIWTSYDNSHNYIEPNKIRQKLRTMMQEHRQRYRI